MKRNRNIVCVTSLALACAAASAHAQLNLGANAGTVRYEQVAATQSLSLNPEFMLTGGRKLLDLAGTFTTASDGSRSLEAGATLWGATRPLVQHLQLTGLLQGSYTDPRGDSTSYSALGFGELAWAGDGWGIAAGAGAVRGVITGSPAIDAVRGGVRGWTEVGAVSLGLAVQPTALSTRVWFTDVSASGEVDPGRAEISATALLRQSPATGLDFGGEVDFAYHLTGRVAVAATAGRYLRDPFQGLPQGLHLTVGAVLTLWRPKPADSEGAGQASLSDVDFKALGINPRSMGQSTVRTTTAVSKGQSASAAGRSHRP